MRVQPYQCVDQQQVFANSTLVDFWRSSKATHESVELQASHLKSHVFVNVMIYGSDFHKLLTVKLVPQILLNTTCEKLISSLNENKEVAEWETMQ